jgi:hypothetical protein
VRKKKNKLGIMVGMLRIIGLALFAVLLTGCGYDGHYRYPCQDPANWENAECKPPICTVNGACPEDLVGSDITNGTESTVEEVPNEQE